MEIQSHINTVYNSVCYRIGTTLIDPGDSWDGFENAKTVLLTHAHFDHIYGLNQLLRMSPHNKVYTNEQGKEMLLDARKNMSLYHGDPFVFTHPEQIVLVKDGEEINLGNKLIAKAIFTPGHHPSCITWIVGDVLFSGDSYIPGIKTVTNLPGGDKKKAIESLALIKKLASDYTVHPGHLI